MNRTRPTLLAAVLALLAVAAGGGSPAAGATAAAPPLPPVLSITALGIVQQHPSVYGRDGTFSALVGGRSVWSFGDTPLAVPGVSGDHWVDNSMAWTADLDASDGIALEGNRLDSTGAPAEFLPLTAAERAYNDAHDVDHCTADPCGAEFALWAGPVVPDPARNRILHLYTEIWRVPGREGWKGVGGGIAVQGANGKVTRPVQDPDSRTPTLMWTGDDVQFNAASVVVGQMLYAYGCRAGFLVMHCKV
ncbi:MAG TPA: hypothetical protein VEO00_03120, partial [Actinomycetota bacterium]|nr:hypothetical protein [Actinomycetota bacterium]